MVGIRSVFTILLFFFTAEALALSCAPLQFDAAAIDGLEIIFEGVVEEKNATTLWKRIKIKFGFEDEDLKTIYTYKVTRLWKGESIENERVKVIASPGWGQQAAYQVGKTYMVFGKPGDEPGVYKASPGWCGFDRLPKEQVMKVLEHYHSETSQNIDIE